MEKIDVMRAKSGKKVSREEYIRVVLMQHTMAEQIQEEESNYQELLEGKSTTRAAVIEGLIQ